MQRPHVEAGRGVGGGGRGNGGIHGDGNKIIFFFSIRPHVKREHGKGP